MQIITHDDQKESPMPQQPETLNGIVTDVVYTNPRNGYGVLKIKTDDGGETTVVGFAPDPAPGERLEATGRWETHIQYGMQFKADTIVRTLPADAAAMLEYLSSRVVSGIGPATAAKLVAHFGAQTIAIMSDEPQRLSEVSGITPKRAALIGETFAQQNSVRRLMEFLCMHRLPPHLAVQLAEAYGPGAIEEIKEDPWLLVGEPFLVDFSLADRLAAAQSFDGGDPRRVSAAVRYELMINAYESGHVYLPEDTLVSAVEALVGAEAEETMTAIRDLAEQGSVIREEGGRRPVCYLASLYEAECAVADRLRTMNQKLPAKRGLSALLSEVEQELGMDYAPAQKEALLLAAEHQCVLLTGGPGTGKTTTLRAMLTLFDKLSLDCVLAAPTGRAAKRMQELTGREAQTVHRLLEVCFDPATGLQIFSHDEDNPITADVVIVDEMSMVDIELMRALTAALPPDARLVLVGDPDQLPSVGPGLVLSDLIKNGTIPSVHLTEVFRQASESRIITRAHEINRGELGDLRQNEGDFFFLSRRDPQMALETILSLCAVRVPEKMGIPSSQIQVLSPTRKGLTGTVNLNRQLQTVLNPAAPDKAEHRFGEYIFRVGDRVMQIKNNYDLLWRSAEGKNGGVGVFNGDVGIIKSVDVRAEQLLVCFDDRFVTYAFELLSELEPAFAMTVHKAQGSEYHAVVLAALPGPPLLMNRKVLYTAVTRARGLMIVVGDENTVRGMTENLRNYGRYSGLKKRLRNERTPPKGG